MTEITKTVKNPTSFRKSYLSQKWNEVKGKSNSANCFSYDWFTHPWFCVRILERIPLWVHFFPWWLLCTNSSKSQDCKGKRRNVSIRNVSALGFGRLKTHTLHRNIEIFSFKVVFCVQITREKDSTLSLFINPKHKFYRLNISKSRIFQNLKSFQRDLPNFLETSKIPEFAIIVGNLAWLSESKSV